MNNLQYNVKEQGMGKSRRREKNLQTNNTNIYKIIQKMGIGLTSLVL
jgi:hypothetical protein